MTNPNLTIPYNQLNKFCRRYQVQRLALFGSVVTDQFRPDSDIDVLLAFDPSAQVTFLTLGRMSRELADLFQRPVDLVLQDGLKPVIREAVLASALEVYAA